MWRLFILRQRRRNCSPLTMSVFRQGFRSSLINFAHPAPYTHRLVHCPRLSSFPEIISRSYASKAKSKNRDQPSDAPSSKRSPVATSSLIPGSQQALSDPEAQAEHERASAKMSTAVEWFRREAAQLDARASGRVTPQLLSPVRVALPSAEGEGGEDVRVRLEEVATVGVRDGSMLIITVFDADVSALALDA